MMTPESRRLLRINFLIEIYNYYFENNEQGYYFVKEKDEDRIDRDKTFNEKNMAISYLKDKKYIVVEEVEQGYKLTITPEGIDIVESFNKHFY